MILESSSADIWNWTYSSLTPQCISVYYDSICRTTWYSSPWNRYILNLPCHASIFIPDFIGLNRNSDLAVSCNNWTFLVKTGLTPNDFESPWNYVCMPCTSPSLLLMHPNRRKMTVSWPNGISGTSNRNNDLWFGSRFSEPLPNRTLLTWDWLPSERLCADRWSTPVLLTH
jgi:hypothetical protein